MVMAPAPQLPKATRADLTSGRGGLVAADARVGDTVTSASAETAMAADARFMRGETHPPAIRFTTETEQIRKD
jgi:hypothetical protein